MRTWYMSQTASYAAIKATGANAVRVVVSGGRWQPAETTQDIVNIINLCKVNRLICILEDHDTTGYGEDGAAYSQDQAVNFWISVQSALTGQENYVILNIGNEPIGNNNPAQWTQPTVNAIQRLRNAGFQHTFMVDAPNWGQDWQFVMRDNAQTVYNADPTGNTILSIHMYGVFPTADVISAYVDSFINRGLPLVIGEFGWVDSDEDAILATAQSRGIGYLSWTWSGNTDPVLDVVVNQNGTDLHDQKTPGATASSAVPTVCNRPRARRPSTADRRAHPRLRPRRPRSPRRRSPRPPRPRPRPARPSRRPVSGTATYTKVNEWPGGFQGDVRVTNGQRITQIWSGRTSQTASPHTVANETWNGALRAGQSVNFGFLGSWTSTNGAPTVTCSRTP